MQCCGSGCGIGSGRIRNFLPDPESDPEWIISDLPGSPYPEWIWDKTSLIKLLIPNAHIEINKNLFFQKIAPKSLSYKNISIVTDRYEFRRCLMVVDYVCFPVQFQTDSRSRIRIRSRNFLKSRIRIRNKSFRIHNTGCMGSHRSLVDENNCRSSVTLFLCLRGKRVVYISRIIGLLDPGLQTNIYLCGWRIRIRDFNQKIRSKFWDSDLSIFAIPLIGTVPVLPAGKEI